VNKRIDFSFLCLLLSVLFQTASIGFGKQAAITINIFSLWAVVTNIHYLLSLACLGLQAIVWPLALRKYPLALAYFFMSSVFINIMLMSKFIFSEAITKGNIAGTGFIMAGIIILARQEKQTSHV